jgi:HK97 family phage prohead protease
MEADFSGYATKTGLKCSDGRTIMPDAFKHQDKMTVPLVWQHGHHSPENILGHAVLENRQDGVYTQGFFNSTPTGQSAKKLVEHGDITFLSIYANQLIEKGKQVFHGAIREVSLVLAGANPGAKIDYVAIQHSDGDVETLEDEAVITTGEQLVHGDGAQVSSDDKVVEDVKKVEDKVSDDQQSDEDLAHAADSTLREVYDTLTPEQKDVVNYMLGMALEGTDSAKHSDDNNQEGTDMTHNVFETGTKADDAGAAKTVLSHSDIQGIFADARKPGQTMKSAVEAYALAHGITNIDLLFPDAKSVTDRPDWDKRRTEWVQGVINGTTKRPFSRIKSWAADLTEDEARAKGYIKGNLKKEEFFSVSKRVTTPTTIYKKQKLDRDDIVDITDFDVVVWMKQEMRLMLDEELARAILIGDGRDPSDEDKIKDPSGTVTEGAGIRSIANDHELYTYTVNVNIDDASSDYSEIVDALILNRRFYKGSGTPTFYTTEETLSRLLMVKDGMKRRMYRSVQELATELRVAEVVPVEVLEGQGNLLGIIVNLTDYTLGADRGGELTTFDDFDIDYNQYKYLMETRLSGALTKLRSAIVLRSTAAANVLVDPAPAARAGNVVTVPTKTGVVYKNKDTSATLTTGSPTTLTTGQTLNVQAVPAAGYYFDNNVDDEWSYKYKA